MVAGYLLRLRFLRLRFTKGELISKSELIRYEASCIYVCLLPM